MAQISSGTDPAENLELVAAATERAAAGGAELVVFPEATMCRFGVSLGPIAAARRAVGRQGAEIAAERVGVVAGMFTPDGDRVKNTLLAVTPDGERAGYDKIHLYDAFGFAESRTVAPGAEPVIITVAGCRVGLATCYDIRFPRLFTTLARAGADLIVVPASWGPGRAKCISGRPWPPRGRSTRPRSSRPSGRPNRPIRRSRRPAPTGIGHSASQILR